jgi:Zn-dependent protease
VPANDYVGFGPVRVTRRELRDLLKAWAAITLAFSIVVSGGSFGAGFVFVFFICGLSAGVGFLLHELAHKFAARRFGCFEEFVASDQMLLLSVFMSFFGFVFAAPGAVYIAGPADRKTNGVISAAGPLTNLLLAAAFMILPFGALSSYGAAINSWLAFFNLLPLPGFDGAKIWGWSKKTYAALIVPALIMAF